jgi:histone acetyltransferase (RNA polymerase elongator complex component)
MMIGLPGDTLKRSIYTAKRIIELGASNTRIYPTVVIRDTVLHKWYDEGKFRPLSFEEAVEWTSQILPLFEDAGVKVLRVGLHPSEGLLSGEELVAGPFHPSFKELVLTAIWKEKLMPLMKLESASKIEIEVPEKEINYAIGYTSGNKNLLKSKYRLVKFLIDPNLAGRAYRYRLDDIPERFDA